MTGIGWARCRVSDFISLRLPANLILLARVSVVTIESVTMHAVITAGVIATVSTEADTSSAVAAADIMEVAVVTAADIAVSVKVMSRLGASTLFLRWLNRI